MTPARPPVFLNLLAIRLPVAAVMSIAHRVAGVVLFLALPPATALLSLVLESEAGWQRAVRLLEAPTGRVGSFLLLWALAHHWLAGLRYLLIDLDRAVQAPLFRHTAWWVLLGAPLLALLLTLELTP